MKPPIRHDKAYSGRTSGSELHQPQVLEIGKDISHFSSHSSVETILVDPVVHFTVASILHSQTVYELWQFSILVC